MDEKLKIILVDDHDMFRDGIKALLTKNNFAEIIGEASNGAEFLGLIETRYPDIVLMDISMPVMNGLEATKKATQKYPNIKILILSMISDEEHYYYMIHCGAKGYVLKTARQEELIHAINTVTMGDNYFTSEFIRKIKKHIQQNELSGDERALIYEKLENMEKEILRYLASGQSINESAERLQIEQSAAEKYLKQMLEKTNTPDTITLIMFALQNQIINV